MDSNAALEEAMPRVVRAGQGYRWLAISPEGAAFPIAVLGSSEADAREKYQHRLAAWRALAALGEDG
jgi:hypothetical protein